MESGFIIENAAATDAEAIRVVQRKTWLATYLNAELGITKDYIKDRLDGPRGELIKPRLTRIRSAIAGATAGSAVYVARSGNSLAGYVFPTLIDGQKHVGALYVLPEYQGRNLGTLLMQKVFDWHGESESVYVHVAITNLNAIRFYKRLEFEETRRDIIDNAARNQGIPEIPCIEMVRRA